MRTSLALLILALLPASIGAAQTKVSNPAEIQELLKDYTKSLTEINSTYQELETLQPPLRYASGEKLTQEALESKRKSVSSVQKSVRRLRASPRNLKYALELVIQTDDLNSDVSSLAELAFDSDQEELAQRLNQLSKNMDQKKHALEDYAVQLAGSLQSRVRSLANQNRKLRRQVGSAKSGGAEKPAGGQP